ARLSLALVGTFLGLLVTLHVLEPAYNSGHFTREYQLSRHGWMMSLAFCCLGLAATGGLVLDPVYSGKGMASLIALIEEHRWSRHAPVVSARTGGAPALFANVDVLEL